MPRAVANRKMDRAPQRRKTRKREGHRCQILSESFGAVSESATPYVAKAIEDNFLSASERKMAEREGFERLLPLEAKSLN